MEAVGFRCVHPFFLASAILTSMNIVYVEADALSKAMVSYEKALDWQDLFELAVRTETSDEDLVAMGYRVAEDLTSKKRFAEAGRVLLDYAQDVREAIIALVAGNLFSEARRVVCLDSIFSVI
jgi:elongator complex protein 1